jgi:hypothetical protein
MAESIQARHVLVGCLSKISWQEFGVRVVPPKPPIVTAQIAAGNEGRAADVMFQRMNGFDVAIDATLRESPFFGRVRYVGQRECIFEYFDGTTRQGLMLTTHEIMRHEHHLVQTRERKLTDEDVVLPRKQQRLVQMIPSRFHSQIRIVSGTLILMNERDAGTVTHDHAFGRFLRPASKAAIAYGPKALGGAAIGAATVGATLGIISLLKSAAGAMAVVAVADPALVIGDLVFSGWLENEVQ